MHRRRRGGTPPPGPPCPPPPLLRFQCLRLTANILLRRLRSQEDLRFKIKKPPFSGYHRGALGKGGRGPSQSPPPPLCNTSPGGRGCPPQIARSSRAAVGPGLRSPIRGTSGVGLGTACVPADVAMCPAYADRVRVRCAGGRGERAAQRDAGPRPPDPQGRVRRLGPPCGRYFGICCRGLWGRGSL